MISTYQRLKRRRDAGEINGFTLIELLIVIVVLGILAAVVIFALGGITGKSQVAACQADGATVSTAISALHAQAPGVTADMAMLTETSFVAGGVTYANGPYIQSWPSATLTNNGYKYTIDSTTGKLEVTTKTAAIADYAGPSSCSGA